MWRKIRTSDAFRRILGRSVASYLRLVWNTQRVTIEPADLYEWIDGELPLILTFWHGQHFLAPFVPKSHHRAKVMISRSYDADVNAVAAEALGIGTIRGSGTHRKNFHEKGGVAATRQMIETLEQGINVAMTADVPKISRRAGLGIVSIAKHSGRPIYPVAIATSRRMVMKRSWDKSSLHLPFGRAALVAGKPIIVEAGADDAALERARKQVEDELNRVTARAEELVGRAAKAAGDGI
ncbi:MAG: lysophospholipid acyltransferase family protein [Xanthobacteraceae bacterium]|nr:lysophospholipid acyltransferase family protein [Xanthobacteraceae bacterium]MBX3534780.1 lysophospholipid acyltransferase family protein [Xanthobacteraceae bacterium]MCW5673708.1 lysophospholipid acyltransferase family protein [Xanthobacteraceae bacterium]MCW5678510.1 lysophospholipid acyltransferase family protein [Xanthobacteraceae bacterium]